MCEEKKKRIKEYQMNYREAKNHANKSALQIAIAKIFFVCSFINF